MAIDSSHWYLPTGEPFYTVKAKAGHDRPVTIADARKVNAVPSVTTVLGIMDKPELVTWRVKQGILSALTLSRNEGEGDDDYLARVMADSKKQVVDAADEGTRIHDALETSYKGGDVPEGYRRHVDAVREAIRARYPGVDDWVSERSFAHALGFGGKVDLHSPSTGIVIDFKGKDGDFTDNKKLAYDQHYQLGGYHLGLELPNAECVNVFVSRTHPGCVSLHTWTAKEVEQGAQIFLAALNLWRLVKRY
jgi:hypothetical protein